MYCKSPSVWVGLFVPGKRLLRFCCLYHSSHKSYLVLFYSRLDDHSMWRDVTRHTHSVNVYSDEFLVDLLLDSLVGIG